MLKLEFVLELVYNEFWLLVIFEFDAVSFPVMFKL